MKLGLLIFALLFVSAGQLSADTFTQESAQNWHQWRGPDASGSSNLANPPVAWSDTQNVRWKTEVPGKGSSSPIVWGDRVFLLTAIKTERAKPAGPAAESQPQRADPGGGRGRGFFGGGPAPTNFYQFVVMAFDRASGKEVWRRVVTEEVPHEAGHNTNTFVSSSVTTDGERLYAYFGSRGIYCLDMQGRVLWQGDFGAMRTAASFGEGSSPSIHGETLVVPWDHEGDSFIVALDAQTGEERWKVTRDEGTTWATPLITEFDGKTQVITNGKNRVRSYDLSNGELIWECGGQVSNPIPSPVRFEDNVVCMTGFRGNAIYSIPLSAKGDITGSDQVVWNAEDAAPYVPSPVLYDGQLYFVKGNKGLLVSRDAKSGDVIIEETRIPGVDGDIYSSPVAAAGRIYFSSRAGTTIVLKHGAKLEVLATNTLGEGIDASPALVGNQLFLRGEIHLYCIE